MIDLHTHSTHSDGTLTPHELVEQAARIGLTALGLTDHDSIDGVAEADAAGRKLGVEIMPGVEINLEHDRVTLDLLGYFPGALPGYELRRALEELRHYRDVRNAQILERLRALGYPIEPAELAEIAGGGAVGRPHIGEAMRRRGYVESISDAFARFLRRGAPAWVDRRRLSLSEAVRLIHRADGLAAIAHPGIIRADAAGLARLVREARRCGVSGLECYYPAHDEAMVARALALADTNDMVPTGGSDFHGATKPDVRLGVADGDQARARSRARRAQGALGRGARRARARRGRPDLLTGAGAGAAAPVRRRPGRPLRRPTRPWSSTTCRAGSCRRGRRARRP